MVGCGGMNDIERKFNTAMADVYKKANKEC